MKKLVKNTQGFSLVELLIVIAIMGVIAAIAFATFASLLQSSNRKSDHLIAEQIRKAIEAYMFSTNDNKLNHLIYGTNISKKDMHGEPSTELIFALQNTITCELNGEKIEPLLVPKEGQTPSSSNFSTRSNLYKGYRVEVYPDITSCNVIPVNNISDAVVNIN